MPGDCDPGDRVDIPTKAEDAILMGIVPVRNPLFVSAGDAQILQGLHRDATKN